MNKLDDIKRGDSIPITVEFQENNSVIDISGYKVWITLKTTPEIDNASAELYVINLPGEHSDPVNGQTILSLTSADTDITTGSYYYEIGLEDALNNVYTMKFDTDRLNVTD